MLRLCSAAVLSATLIAAALPAAPAVDDLYGRLIDDAQYVIRRVRDYQCTFVKQERVGGELLCEQTAEMTCRHQPFSVRLKFTAPPSVAGQEAAYVCGKNKGCMRVRSNGLLACIGCLSLSLDDPRAMRTNRHRIDEAGIGCLVEQMAQRHAQEHGLSGLKEEFTAVEYDGRLCTRVETTWLEPRDGIYAHRCVVLFDRDSRLPLRFEAYGDPTDEEPDGPLLELYSYHAMRFNLGVDDQAFGY